MTRFVTTLTTVAVLAIAAAPVVYAYTSLV